VGLVSVIIGLSWLPTYLFPEQLRRVRSRLVGSCDPGQALELPYRHSEEAEGRPDGKRYHSLLFVSIRVVLIHRAKTRVCHSFQIRVRIKQRAISYEGILQHCNYMVWEARVPTRAARLMAG
jgi:hypothetical protein